MFRFFYRVAGLLFLAAAFASLVVDATRSIAGSDLLLTPVSEALSGKLGSIQSSLERLHPMLWDLARLLLRMPIWFALFIAALILLRLARPAAPRIGYSSRP